MVEDPTNSFARLRNIINQERNCIPYLYVQFMEGCFNFLTEFNSRAIYLKDLTLIDEGNPDIVSVDDKPLINFPKSVLMSRRIDNMIEYQHSTYRVAKIEPLYTFLFELPGLIEEELYNLSLEREPKEKEK